MGGFLPAVVQIRDANNVRVDLPAEDGTFQPIILKLDPTISHTCIVGADGTTTIYLSANGTIYANDPTKLPVDGSGQMLGNLKVGGNRITGLANGIASTDAVNVGQMNAAAAAADHFYHVTSTAAMQAITSATAGDECVVSTSGDDFVWLAVTVGKYSYGANCLAGIGVDWYLQIDRIYGEETLSAGHAFVYLPGLSSSSKVVVSYKQIIGQSGTPYAAPTTDGADLYSTAGIYDGSIVTYEIAVL